MAPQKKARFAPPHPFPFPPRPRPSVVRPNNRRRSALSSRSLPLSSMESRLFYRVYRRRRIISRSVARRVSSCATGRVTPEIGLGWCQGWRRVAGCRQNPRDMRVNFINKIFWISHIGSFIVRGGRQSFINLICLELLLNIK